MTENPEVAKLLPIQPGVGQNIALRVSFTAKSLVFLIFAVEVHSVFFLSSSFIQ